MEGLKREKQKRISVRTFAAVIAITGVFWAWPTSAFTEPSEAPPGGTVAAPLNTSSTNQTKAGALTVQGGLTVGSSTTPKTLCLNPATPANPNECITHWSDIVASGTIAARLDATPAPFADWADPASFDSGFISIAANDTQNWAIGGRSSEPANAGNWATGIYGITHPDFSGGTSVGVAGIALNNVGAVGISYGVFGTEFGSKSYAAWFAGRVGINQPTPESSFVMNKGTLNMADFNGSVNDGLSIYVDATGSALYVEQENTGASAYAAYLVGKVNVDGQLAADEFCLNGSCRTSWPAPGGASVWARNAGNVIFPAEADGTLRAGDKVAIGGSDQNAPFYFDPVGESMAVNSGVLQLNSGALGVGRAATPPPQRCPPEGCPRRDGGDVSLKSATWLDAFVPPVQAGSVTNPSGLPQNRILARNGVISIDNSDTGGSKLELGNAGRDIASTGTLFFRPGSLESPGAVLMEQVGTDANLTLSGNVGIGQRSPAARLVINDGVGDPGNAGDTVGLYANTPAGTSGLYVQQTGAGWAAYMDGNAAIMGKLGVNNNSPAAQFVVNYGVAGNGSTGDAIATYSNSTTKSAIYAQNNSGGLSGYFSGRMYVDGLTADNPAIFAELDSTNNTIEAHQYNKTGWAGYFYGRLRAIGLDLNPSVAGDQSIGVQGTGGIIHSGPAPSIGVYGKGGLMSLSATGDSIGVFAKPGGENVAGPATQYGIFSEADDRTGGANFAGYFRGTVSIRDLPDGSGGIYSPGNLGVQGEITSGYLNSTCREKGDWFVPSFSVMSGSELLQRCRDRGSCQISVESVEWVEPSGKASMTAISKANLLFVDGWSPSLSYSLTGLEVMNLGVSPTPLAKQGGWPGTGEVVLRASHNGGGRTCEVRADASGSLNMYMVGDNQRFYCTFRLCD